MGEMRQPTAKQLAERMRRTGYDDGLRGTEMRHPDDSSYRAGYRRGRERRESLDATRERTS